MSVLIVDDDRDVVSFMQDALVHDGYNVTAVSDPTRAVPTLQRSRFHVVLLDLMMPTVDGLTVLADIRKVDREIPVVILTGYASVDSAVEAIKLDVSGYIRKPFSIDELRGVVQRATTKHQRDPERLLLETLGQRLRQLRQEQDLTLRQLSLRTGLSVSALSQIERTECNASISSLHKIASALDIQLTTLFKDF